MRTPRPKRPARVRRGWLFGLAALAGLIAAAPTIVATTPARDAALAAVVPPEVGTLTAAGAAFGWTGPTALTGVELRDPAGAPVFSAARVEVAGSLLDLAGGGPVAVTVTEPVVYVELRGQQPTNLEAIVAAWKQHKAKKRAPAQPGAARKPKRPIDVAVTAGQARITDAVTGERWLVSDLSATLAGVSTADPLSSVALETAGKLAEVADAGPAAGPAGDFALRVGDGDDGRRLARLRLGSAPLTLAAAAVRRRDPAARGAGWLSVEGEAAWNAGGPPPTASALRTLLARGLATSGRVSLVGPEYRGRLTGGQPLRLASVEAPWRLATDAERLRIEQFEVRSDVGSARLTGAITPAELDAWLAGRPRPPGGVRLAGDVDLARLAAVAPNVLRLRDDVRIDSGRVRLDVTGAAAGDATRLTGSVQTESLAGVSRGRPITWRNPLQATFAASRSADGALRVEQLRCESEFVTAEASGDADAVRATASFDLDRLATQLRQFVNLGDGRLAGRGSARGEWRRAAGGAWRLTTDGEVEDLFVGRAHRPLAREERLRFEATADGALGDAVFARTGAAVLSAGDDRLEIDLAAAADGPERPLRLSLAGDAAQWFRRARLVAPSLPAPEALRLAGRIEATANGGVSTDGVRLGECRVAIADLAADLASPALAIREPRVEWRGDVAVYRNGAIGSDSSELVSSAVSLRTRNLRVTPGSPADSGGDVAFRGDAARLGAWLPAAGSGPRYEAAGGVSGTASLTGTPWGLAVVANAVGEQLALLQTSQAGRAVVWSEPQLTADLSAQVQIISGDTPRTAIELSELRVVSQTLAASAAGGVDDVAAVRGVRLDGTIDYDLEKLSPLLWPKLGDNVRLVGRDRATFRFSSDPAADSLPAPGGAAPASGLAALEARVEAPWSGADVFGLPIGPGRLGATLSRGVLRTDPLAIAVGEGRLTAQANATLADPAAMTLAPGPLVTDVGISAPVAERILKFIAPVLADATRIDGRFSMTLNEFTAPLADPGAARANGVLDIHAARVLPGPSIAEWADLVNQVRGVVRDGVEGVASPDRDALLTIGDKSIPFQMADRRVYHRGLEFNVGDAIVTSEGSVGVDETLDLLLTVPILDEWVARRPVLLAGLRGQALRFPVRGTLSSPELDREAFRQLSRQLLQSAAQGAIDQGLNLLIDRLRSR